jgi:hypothetical protein
MGRAHNTNWEKRNRILMGKPEEKRPLGRPRRRRMDNIKWLKIGNSGGLLRTRVP